MAGPRESIAKVVAALDRSYRRRLFFLLGLKSLPSTHCSAQGMASHRAIAARMRRLRCSTGSWVPTLVLIRWRYCCSLDRDSHARASSPRTHGVVLDDVRRNDIRSSCFADGARLAPGMFQRVRRIRPSAPSAGADRTRRRELVATFNPGAWCLCAQCLVAGGTKALSNHALSTVPRVTP
jgi:hypothetical protein